MTAEFNPDNHNEKNTREDQTDPIRVMVVDDSAILRGLLSKIIDGEPNMKTVETASNGKRALYYLERSDPEVIILDIEMPEMDGLEAIPKILEMRPDLKIIMASTLTERNASISLRAIELGASDYLAKPSTSLASKDNTAEDFKKSLLEKIEVLGRALRDSRGNRRSTAKTGPVKQTTKAPHPRSSDEESNDQSGLGQPLSAIVPVPSFRPKVIAIGSSTGGPQALMTLFKQLNQIKINLPIVITQHMPATFTKILADHIEKQVGRPCKEAETGDPLLPKTIYVAPGGYHLTFEARDDQTVCILNEGEPVNFCRPSVDVMLSSLIEQFGGKILTLILTGMGQDGLKACRKLKEKGGKVIAQDSATSVVWGMPGAVVDAGVHDYVMAIDNIGPAVEKIVRC